MDGVWDAIEEAQIPVSHHIGESPPSSPNQFNALSIGMLQSVASFRDTFGKYIFGGILDRHPGLQIGYFEGGINWVPSALQDAEHIAASFRHMADLKVQHEPTYYWEQPHVRLVHGRPAGARTCFAHIGVDRVMWSTDFPHNESTYGYSNKSLAVGRRRGGRRRRHGHGQRQHQALPRGGRLMPTGLMASAPPTQIPAQANIAAHAAGAVGANPVD